MLSLNVLSIESAAIGLTAAFPMTFCKASVVKIGASILVTIIWGGNCVRGYVVLTKLLILTRGFGLATHLEIGGMQLHVVTRCLLDAIESIIAGR